MKNITKLLSIAFAIAAIVVCSTGAYLLYTNAQRKQQPSPGYALHNKELEAKVEYQCYIIDSLTTQNHSHQQTIAQLTIHNLLQDSVIQSFNQKFIQLARNRHEKEIHLYALRDTAAMVRLFTELRFTPRQQPATIPSAGNRN